MKKKIRVLAILTALVMSLQATAAFAEEGKSDAHGDRGVAVERTVEKSEKPEKPEKSESAEKPGKPEKTEQANKSENSEKPEKSDKTEKPEKTEIKDKTEKADKEEEKSSEEDKTDVVSVNGESEVTDEETTDTSTEENATEGNTTEENATEETEGKEEAPEHGKRKFTKEELETKRAEYKEKHIDAKAYFEEIKEGFSKADKETRKHILSEIAEVKKELKDESIGVFARGKEIDFGKYDNVRPRIENNRTLVPIRAVTESLGAEVTWDEETQTITITKDGNEVVLQIGSTSILVNGVEVECEVAAKIENGRTLVPLRIISEALRKTVDWDEESGTIIIEDDDKQDGNTEEADENAGDEAVTEPVEGGEDEETENSATSDENTEVTEETVQEN